MAMFPLDICDAFSWLDAALLTAYRTQLNTKCNCYHVPNREK